MIVIDLVFHSSAMEEQCWLGYIQVIVIGLVFHSSAIEEQCWLGYIQVIASCMGSE